MKGGNQKIRMSFDELAYLLASAGILHYPFFEMEKRQIGPQKAVALVNAMYRKGWLFERAGGYDLREDLRELLLCMQKVLCVFSVRTFSGPGPDLLCCFDGEKTVAAENDREREESVVLSLHSMESLAEMLWEEGYLQGAESVGVKEEELAEKILVENAQELDRMEDCGKENTILIMEACYAGEDRKGSRLMIRNFSAYPYILIRTPARAERIPYHREKLAGETACWLRGLT
jgi:hypothetical protein